MIKKLALKQNASKSTRQCAFEQRQAAHMSKQTTGFQGKLFIFDIKSVCLTEKENCFLVLRTEKIE